VSVIALLFPVKLISFLFVEYEQETIVSVRIKTIFIKRILSRSCLKRSFNTNSREGGKTLSIDMQWHLSFRLTVFPANLTFEIASDNLEASKHFIF